MNIGYLYILIPFFVHGYEVFELDFHIDINNNVSATAKIVKHIAASHTRLNKHAPTPTTPRILLMYVIVVFHVILIYLFFSSLSIL